MYNIGELMNLDPADPCFDDADAAIRAAISASADNWLQAVWAVWDDDTGKIFAIIYQGIAYT